MEETNDLISVQAGNHELLGGVEQRDHTYGIAAPTFATIPEGATVMATRSSSPPQSASATTGSSTTPTSIDKEYPRNNAPQRSQQQHFQHQNKQQEIPTSALKLLVSNNIAGSIIGRAGQTISELQTASNSRIKLSQSQSYYPGSQDRVCLVQGEPHNVKTALNLLLERIYVIQENQHAPAWKQQEQQPVFDFMCRLLIPVNSCGMVIGKQGTNIRLLQEKSKVKSIRLSPKNPTIDTGERVVTITSLDLQSCVDCIHMIFESLASHPDISRYSNMTTTYGTYHQNVPNVGSVAVPVPPQQPHGFSQNEWEFPQPPRRIASSPDMQGLAVQHRFEDDNSRLVGYGGPFTQLQVPTSPPMYLMPRHFVAPRPGFVEEESQQQERTQQVTQSASAPDLLAVQFEQSLHVTQNSQQTTQHVQHHPNLVQQPPHHHQHHPGAQPQYATSALVPQTPTMIAPGCFTAQVLIPDSMIGSILGRGGRTLTDLQMLSGTQIRISQRGEYMPGTRSRIVTVRGPSVQAVWQAQCTMSQRLSLAPTASFQVAVARGGSGDNPYGSSQNIS